MNEEFEVTVKRKTHKWWDSFWVLSRNKKITGLQLEDFEVNTKVTSFYEKKKGLYQFSIETNLEVNEIRVHK